MQPRFNIISQNFATNTLEVKFSDLLSEEQLALIPQDKVSQASTITKSVKIVINPDGTIDTQSTINRIKEQLLGAVEKAKAGINQFIENDDPAAMLDSGFAGVEGTLGEDPE